MDTIQNKVAVAIIALLLCVSSITLAQSITTQDDSVSYALGIVYAKQLKQQGITKVDHELLSAALRDHLAGKETLINDEDSGDLMMLRMAQIKKARMDKAKDEGINFLAENAKRPEVTVTESGLQYEIIRGGLGDQHPTLKNTVKTHYHGMLVDGTVFDSSVDRGQPISFPLGNVIKGWQEGLQLMKVGDKYKLYVPSELAYGAQGAGQLIAPHSALIFEVELLEIER